MGCKCKGGFGALGHNQQKIFLSLIDSGAGVKAYTAKLGMTLDNIRQHQVKIPVYRLAVAAQEEIDKIKMDTERKTIDTINMVAEVRAKLRRDIEGLGV